MRILLTGIPGSGYHEILDALEAKMGTSLKVYRGGRDLLAAAKAAQIPVTKDEILDTEESTLRSLRFTVFRSVVQQMKAQQAEYSIVQTHTSFRWDKTLRPAFDWPLVRELNPDVFVTITDNWQDIWGWMQQDSQWKDKLTIPEILFWREEEFLLTKMMAEELERDFFLVPRVEAAGFLEDLLVRPTATKIYLSHPMTGVKSKKGVKSFVTRLRQLYMVFDPSSMSDLEFSKLGQFVRTRFGKFPFRSAGKERVFLDMIAGGQTRRIDFQFIDQSPVTLVYYFPGSGASTGVQTEMVYAKGTNKKVYVFWKRKGTPMLFVQQYSKKTFTSKDKLLRFLKVTHVSK